ncbi:MAG: UDP-2,3-diacylglucosamine diphosphatase LpxG, partial [Chlamydiales bacterium]|nr:UDP-2,3-diacylglucosamine diphosphatase LpxG [Chlamydiales bacterium]
ITVLHNESTTLNIANASLEIVGVGDLWAQHFEPQKAFSKSQKKLPNSLRLLLCHNPDAIDCGLDKYEFDLALSGHTHGSQVNLPLMGINVTNSSHDKFKRGLYEINEKQLYVTRGISSHFPFRWFSRPEITLFNFRST